MRLEIVHGGALIENSAGESIICLPDSISAKSEVPRNRLISRETSPDSLGSPEALDIPDIVEHREFKADGCLDAVIKARVLARGRAFAHFARQIIR